MKKFEYEILFGSTRKELGVKVERKVGSGFSLHGAPFYDGTFYCQCVTKEKRSISWLLGKHSQPLLK